MAENNADDAQEMEMDEDEDDDPLNTLHRAVLLTQQNALMLVLLAQARDEEIRVAIEEICRDKRRGSPADRPKSNGRRLVPSAWWHDFLYENPAYEDSLSSPFAPRLADGSPRLASPSDPDKAFRNAFRVPREVGVSPLMSLVHGGMGVVDEPCWVWWGEPCKQVCCSEPSYLSCSEEGRIVCIVLTICEQVYNVLHQDLRAQWDARPDCCGDLGHRCPIKILACLFYLGGRRMTDVEREARIAPSTFHKFFQEFLDLVLATFKTRFLSRPTSAELRAISFRQFEERGFPGCVGCIDCMHWDWEK